MLLIISTLIPVFGIIFLGLVTERGHLMPEGTALALNQFVYWVGLPMLLFSKIAEMEVDLRSMAVILGIMAGALFVYILAHGYISRCFRVHRAENTVFALVTTFPNSAFMGFPIIALLLPDNELAAVVTSLVAATYTFVILIAESKLSIYGMKSESKSRTFYFLLKSLCINPFLIATFFGILVAIFSLPVPQSIMEIPNMLGLTASPLALFCMGMILQSQLSSSQGFTKGWLVKQFPGHVIKSILLPISTYFFLSLFGVDGIALGVATLLSAMPSGIAPYVVAAKYRVGAEDVSLFILVSTAFSVVSLTLTILILQYFYLL